MLGIIKYESVNTSLLEDDPTANQAEFCVHIRSWVKYWLIHTLELTIESTIDSIIETTNNYRIY